MREALELILCNPAYARAKMIFLTSSLACRFAITFKRKIKFLAVAAHPANLAGWISDYQSKWFDRFGHHGASSDETVFAKLVAADDCCVGSDAGALSNQRRDVLIAAHDGRPRVVDVGENHRGPEENIVFADHSSVDAYIVLHLDILPEFDAWADHDILANIALLTKFGIGHDMAKVPNFAARTNFGSGIDYGGRVGGESSVWRVASGECRVGGFAVFVQTLLGGIEDLEHTQTFAAIGDRRLALVATFDEVRALEPQGFLLGDFDQFSVGFLGLGNLPTGPDEGLAIENEFFFPWERIIENQHGMGADDGEFLLLERIDPTHMHMGMDAAGESKRSKGDICHTGVQERFTDTADLIGKFPADQ